MDGVDLHGKWPHGGPDHHGITFEEYLAEVPLLEHKSRQSWRQKIGDLRATLKTLGREDFFLANNEYGLGKGSAFAGTFTRFQNGLVVVELALEMYASGYDIACFWVSAQLSCRRSHKSPNNKTRRCCCTGQRKPDIAGIWVAFFHRASDIAH